MKNRLANLTQVKDLETLKKEFLACMSRIALGYRTLQDIILVLLDMDVTREEMVQWGVEAGYSESWVRTSIGAALIGIGERKRKAGSGPKPPKEAYRVYEMVLEEYGENTVKFLRAALRIAIERQKKVKGKNGKVVHIPAKAERRSIPLETVAA